MKERKKRLKGCGNRRTKTHAHDKLLPLIIQLNPKINPACSNTRNKLPDTEQFPNLFSVHEILYSCATIEFPNALSKRPQTTSVFYRFANQRPHCPRSLVLGVRFEKMFSNLVIWWLGDYVRASTLREFMLFVLSSAAYAQHLTAILFSALYWTVLWCNVTYDNMYYKVYIMLNYVVVLGLFFRARASAWAFSIVTWNA